MSYATSGEVESMFRDITIDADSAVSTADMTLFLENTTEIIEAKLSTLYVVPILVGTSPKSFKIVKQIQMNMVAGMIDDILNSYSEADKKPMWAAKAEMMLKSLVPEKDKKGYQPPPSMILPDATYLGTTQQKSGIKLKADSGRIFEKGKVNW